MADLTVGIKTNPREARSIREGLEWVGSAMIKIVKVCASEEDYQSGCGPLAPDATAVDHEPKGVFGPPDRNTVNEGFVVGAAGVVEL